MKQQRDGINITWICPECQQSSTQMETEDEIPTDKDMSFNVSLPIADPNPVLETSLQDEPLPQVISEDEPTRYTVIKGGSKRGADILIDNQGYIYTFKRKTSITTTWICSGRGKKCYATVTQQSNNNFCRGLHPHTHPGDPSETLKCSARAKVKEAARDDVFVSSGVLAKQALESVSNADLPLPRLDYLARTANRAREKLRPKHPKDLDFTLDESSISEGFLQKDLQIDGQRHIILATALQLQHLAQSKVWYIDGTFKVAREPFIQLFSIRSFIKSGETMKQVLCVHVTP